MESEEQHWNREAERVSKAYASERSYQHMNCVWVHPSGGKLFVVFFDFTRRTIAPSAEVDVLMFAGRCFIIFGEREAQGVRNHAYNELHRGIANASSQFVRTLSVCGFKLLRMENKGICRETLQASIAVDR